MQLICESVGYISTNGCHMSVQYSQFLLPRTTSLLNQNRRVVLRARYVDGRVALEEVARLEMDLVDLNRHNWPVFHSACRQYMRQSFL